MTDNHKKAITVIEHSERTHPIIRAAMAAGPMEPQVWREMLSLQREWEAGEAKKAFALARVALKRDLPTVLERDTTVDRKGAGRFTHTSLAAAMEAITPCLTQYGFDLSWEPHTEGNKVSVTCRLTHGEGHSETCTLEAPPDTSGSKNPAQAIASTITLLQRYSALALLGIATRDMRDPPPREADPNAVDTNRNLRAMGRLAKHGKTREQAEEFLGRSLPDWTEGDLGRLAEWVGR